MVKLSENYKIETARKLTELAIEKELISKHSNEKLTATTICDFFKTIFEQLDTDSATE